MLTVNGLGGLGGVFEVWVFCDNGDREAVAELGLSTTQGGADHLAACLSYWLRFGVFGKQLAEAVPCREDRMTLRELPESLWDRGIHPASVRVRGVRRGKESDNHVREPDELPDTDILSPGELALAACDEAS
jgi:hypothetical protein